MQPERFWYERDGTDGAEFVVVTAAGAKSPAFDHAGLARALSEALGEPTSGKGLPVQLTHAGLSDDLTHLTGQVDKKSVECDVKTLHCRAFDTPAPTPELLPSPDGRWVALTRDDDLFVREVATGHERQLTIDDARFYSWAPLPDNSYNTVVRQKSGQKAALYETYWSPDGRFLIAPLIDERKVAGILTHLVETYIVAGIGINVNQSVLPANLRTPASSLRMESNGCVQSREEIVVNLLESLDVFCSMLTTEGTPSILRLFSSASSYAINRRVIVEESGTRGITAGLDENGFLLLHSDAGTIERIATGGIRPDYQLRA